MQFVEQLIRDVASIDAQTAEGQQCLKAIADNFKGIGTAIDRYRRERLTKMPGAIGSGQPGTPGIQTATVALNGTAPGRTNLKS